MKNIRSTSKLTNAFPARAGRRFVSFLLDFVFVGVLSYLLFLGGQQIAVNVSSYQEAATLVSQEVEYYASYAEPSHIVDYYENEGTTYRKSEDYMALENAMVAVYNSYRVFGNNGGAYGADYTFEEGESYTYHLADEEITIEYASISFYDDDLSYFFLVYPEVSGVSFSSAGYAGLVGVYQEYYSTYYSTYFSTDYTASNFGESYNIPILRPEYAFYTYYYITHPDEASNSYAASYGSDIFYDVFSSRYVNALGEAERLLVTAEPYYSAHYVPYRNAISTQSKVMNWALVICIFLAYILIMAVPKFVLGGERTFGRLLIGLGVIGTDREKVPWWVVAIRCLLGMVGFAVLAAILYLFPPFSGVYDAMVYPFIGNVGLLYFLLGILVIGIVIYVPSLFSAEHRSLLDMAFSCVLVDTRSLGETDDGQPNTGREY